MSDEEGETFPPRKVRSQPCHQEEEATQRLKRSVFSFIVSKSSLKVQSFKVFSQSFKVLIAQDGKVETVIHHFQSLKLHTTGKLKHVFIWFQQ